MNELTADNIVVILKLINRANITGQEAEAAVEVKHKLAFLHNKLTEREAIKPKLPTAVPDSVEFEPEPPARKSSKN